MSKCLRVVLVVALSASASRECAAEAFLVEQGKARAEIVVAENPQRSARLAAHDLQTYVKKITGAHLPIVVKPSPQTSSVFVGRSEHTDRLKITAEGWRGALLRKTGATLAAAGRKDEAATTFRALADDQSADERSRAAAKQKLAP